MTPDKYRETLNEMLELSGLPEDSELDEENSLLTEAKEKEDDKAEEEPEIEEPEEKKEKEEKDSSDEEEEELGDTWEINVKTAGKFKFEMFENYLYVYYRNKKSEKIEIPSRLRSLRREMASLFNKILTHVENAS